MAIPGHYSELDRFTECSCGAGFQAEVGRPYELTACPETCPEQSGSAEELPSQEQSETLFSSDQYVKEIQMNVSPIRVRISNKKIISLEEGCESYKYNYFVFNIRTGSQEL